MAEMKTRQFLPVVTLVLLLAGMVSAQQSAPSPQRLRISQGVAMGLITHRIEPQYPEEARRRSIQGQVVVRFVIDKEGNTTDVFAIEGDPLLRDAAVAAVKQWKFKPYLLNGEPIQVETNATLGFKLNPPLDPGPPGKLRVSQDVAERDILRKVNPVYPAVAVINHIHGIVILSGTIDTKGNMVDVKPVSGHPVLVDAAVQAVKQWKYKPYMLNGQPVAVETTVKISFGLR
jgi:TonB family protein